MYYFVNNDTIVTEGLIFYMGKFSGILLCTDLDDTLLTTDKKISDNNRRAIDYFKSEGGLFTFATGRVPHGAKLMLEYINPNAPMVCFNGAGIYDFAKDKLVWAAHLDKDAVKVLEFVEELFPQAGIEVCSADKIYFAKMNHVVWEHKTIEHFPDLFANYHDITEPWSKVLFMTEPETVPLVKEALLNSEFADKYSFVRSSPNYYELLPKGASKGGGLIELARILGIPREKTIGVGDNENDLTLVQMAGAGVAVANAVDMVKRAADYITVDNNSSAIAAVIRAVEDGKIKL